MRRDADELKALRKRIRRLTRLMAAAGTHALLVILQGVDTAGKDAIIKHVFGRVDPSLLHVTYFRRPSKKAQRHDFLWRAHRAAPARGTVAVWHRSHYEDVIVPVAQGAIQTGDEQYQSRLDAIHAFEDLLVRHGDVLILRIWLDLSQEEQRKRLAARHRKKPWKLSPADLVIQEEYPRVARACRAVLGTCYGQEHDFSAIEADDKQRRDVIVARCVVGTLQPYEAAWRAARTRAGGAATTAPSPARPSSSSSSSSFPSPIGGRINGDFVVEVDREHWFDSVGVGACISPEDESVGGVGEGDRNGSDAER